MNLPSVKKARRLAVLLTLAVLFSCSDGEQDTVLPMSAHQREVIHYFKSVGLGFEYGAAAETTTKWSSDMRIFVGGDRQNHALRAELSETISEINQLATDGFSIEITHDSARSNCYIFLGSKQEFLNLFPDASSTLGSNYGLFKVWIHDDYITKARIFVDTKRPTPTQQKSTLKEELTQSLGLGKDSSKYPNSIFYETPDNGGFATAYSDMDREVIGLLYHSKMKAGLTDGMVNLVLIDIFRQQSTIE